MKKLLVFLIAIVAIVTTAPLMAKGVNMKKYITLSVKKGEEIKMDFVAEKDDTNIQIVSGKHKENLKVEAKQYFRDTTDLLRFKAYDTTMIIYGDIIGFMCTNNKENVTNLDVTHNKDLIFLFCQWNSISSLDLSKNENLTKLRCNNNNLGSLDLSNNMFLDILICYNNPLYTLDVTKNLQLSYLNCSNNALKSLDLTHNMLIKELYFAYNHIEELDLSTQMLLSNMDCSNNKLHRLVLTKNPFIKNIDCSKNQIFTLQLKNNGALSYINCSHNNLRYIDLSDCPGLEFLVCHNNKIELLDFSNNHELKYLNCYNNAFTPDRVNKLYCSLPRCPEHINGILAMLNTPKDTFRSNVENATSDIARLKNWKVKYYEDGLQVNDIPSKGDYLCK